MMEEEPIDDLFKRKLEEADLSFQEEYWLKAQALIEADERRKKRALFFWWTSSGIFACLMVLGIWYMDVLNSESFTTNELVKEENVSENSPNQMTKVTPDSATGLISNSKTIIETEIVSSKNPNSKNAYLKNSIGGIEENKFNASPRTNQGMRSSFSGKHKSNQNNNVVRGQESQRLNTVAEITDSIMFNSSNFIQSQELELLGSRSSYLLANEEVLDPVFNERVPLPALKKSNSLPEKQEPMKKSRTDLEIAIQGPVSSAVGLGIRRSQYLGNRTSLTLGVGASSQHQLNQSFNWDSTNYGFGFSQGKYQLKPIWMLEAIAHVGLTVQIHKSHAISAGFNWHLPLYGFQETSAFTLSDFEQSRIRTTSNWGNPSGINSVISVQLGYEVGLTNRLGIGLYWIGIRRQWQSLAKEQVQDVSQIKLTGRWRL